MKILQFLAKVNGYLKEKETQLVLCAVGGFILGLLF